MTGSFVVLATFAPDGRERCSGLPVVRSGAARLAERLGATFDLLWSAPAAHTAPGGAEQRLTWGLFRRRADQVANR
ncbi:hypothetical protein STAQ_26050 [Allostella sp. ATCC 35155]|nr:hypothetical protein STAQ_26050 [Stella sp. ATCC 35155]